LAVLNKIVINTQYILNRIESVISNGAKQVLADDNTTLKFLSINASIWFKKLRAREQITLIYIHTQTGGNNSVKQKNY
jgi:hypothetical protein